MRAPILALLPLIFTAAACAQSGSVRNAAGAGVPGATPLLPALFVTGASFPAPTTLAPDSRAVIYYSGPASPPPQVSAVVALRPVGSPTTYPARVLAADTATITFVVPPTVPIGPAQLIYQATGDTTKWIEVVIAPISFQLFTNPATGAPIAQFVPPGSPAGPLALATPAQPGQAAVIWGSGSGLTPAIPAITLGGVPQQVLYIGTISPGFGIVQINFRIAANTPLGCYVPLTVAWGPNTTTSFLSTSADGTACQHPFHLSAKDLAALDSGQSLNVAAVAFSSTLTAAAVDRASRQEQISASFTQWSGAFMASRFSAAQPAGCSVATPSEALFAALILGFPASSLGSITLRNGSPLLSLNAQNNFTQTFPVAGASLANIPPSVFPGTWSLTAGPALSSSPPPMLSFTASAPGMLAGAMAPVQLLRSAGQIISWNGTAFGPDMQATLTLTSPNQPTLTCIAPAMGGSVVIPKELLAQIGPGAATLSLRINPNYAAAPNLPFANSDGATTVLAVTQTSADIRPAVLQ